MYCRPETKQQLNKYNKKWPSSILDIWHFWHHTVWQVHIMWGTKVN